VIPFGVENLVMRPADFAGVRLSVEPSVGDVGVFFAAVIAHLERGHTCGRPIIGQFADDGIPRPAMGAIDEWVIKPPIAGIEKFPKAVVAGGEVGGNRGYFALAVFARDNLERFRAGIIGIAN